MSDMSTIMEEQEHSGTSVDARLQKVIQSIRRLSNEAFQQSRATNLYWDDLPNHRSPTEPRSSAEWNGSSRPGIELELFGNDATTVEQIVQEKLHQVESELETVLEDIQEAADSTLVANADEPPLLKTPQQLDREAALLKTKISFLRDCSQARASLDESASMTAAATLNLVESAHRFVIAQDALTQARSTLQAFEQKQKRSEETSESFNDENKSNSAESREYYAEMNFLSEANKMLTAMQTAARRQKVQLMGRAKTLWLTTVELEPNALSVRDSKPPGESSDLQISYDIFLAFGDEGMRALQDILRTFTKSLYDQVFDPLLRKHRDGLVVNDYSIVEVEERSRATTSSVVTTLAANRGPTRRLEWTSEADDESTAELLTDTMGHIRAWKGTFAFMERTLTFLVERVFLRRQDLCAWLGTRLFGKPDAMFETLNLEMLGIESRRHADDNGLLLEPIVDALSNSCVPEFLEAKQVRELANMATELGSFLDPFLRLLEGIGLMTGSSRTKLGAFADSLDQLYVEKRHCVLLNKARDLLMQNDYHNVVMVGVDVPDTNESWEVDGMAVFKLQKSGVSDTAFKLMALCRNAMDESIEQQVAPKDSPLATLPAMLYRSAREMLDLFRAIIPTSKGYEIKHVPRTAAVFHNDCVFLAHHCLTLGPEYKDKYPTVSDDDVKGSFLRKHCLFVDMVPLFRDLAERSLGEMLHLQASQLAELVGQRITVFGDSLQSNELVTEWSEAETALTAGMYHLRHLQSAWLPVLSADILGRSMWYLGDVVFTLFLDQIASAKDISTSACQFVGSLFQRAANEISELVGGNTKHSRVWGRFFAITKFMDMNLNDIDIGLTDGVFQSLTGQELTRLILATFTDSPQRRKIVDLLVTH